MPGDVATLLDSGFFVVRALTKHEMVFARRMPSAFASPNECEEAHAELVRKLDTLNRRQTRFLMDLRQAPGRNDPEFEAIVATHRKRMFEKFAAAAILVRTASGKMQVTRHMREDQSDAVVFLDVRDALIHLGVPLALAAIVDG
jgi:hypothetical protein